MSDDGGSTGVLRDELGVLPPGDVRQCLVALSDTPEVRDLFSYRFADGRFEGQSLGNIILSGLELQHGGLEKAIKVAGDILHITGQVVPVTVDKHTLIARDGAKVYRGEHLIDGALKLSSDTVLHLEPAATINPAAAEAIRTADVVVIAPGSLYTSLLPIFVVGGMADALANTEAQVVAVANLVNKPLQADNWHVADYIQHFEHYLGKGRIDTVLYNTEPLPQDLLDRYAGEGEFPVRITPEEFRNISAKPVGAHLVAEEITTLDPADTMAHHRTLLRHDADRVAAELRKLLV